MAYIRGGNLVLWGPNQASDPAVFKAIDEYADQFGYNCITLNPYYNHYSNSDPLGYKVGRSHFYGGTGEIPDTLPNSQNPQWYSDSQLIKLIDYIHAKGLNVFLKPMIDPVGSDHTPNGQRSGLDPGSAQMNSIKTTTGLNTITISDGSQFPGTIAVGNNIGGTNIPSGSLITNISSDRLTVTISNVATGTSTSTCGIALGSYYVGSQFTITAIGSTLAMNSASPFYATGGIAMIVTSNGIGRIKYTGIDTTANTLTGCSLLSGSGTVSNGAASFSTAAAFWQEYQDFVVHYATILQAHYKDGDIFSVGCELTNMMGGNSYVAGQTISWTPMWPDIIIPAVRAVTNAKLTFSGYTIYGTKLWAALDYLGLDFYQGAAPWPKTSASTTKGSNIITLANSAGTVPLDVGGSISGGNLGNNAVITAIDGLNLTLNVASTATGSATMSFGTTNVEKLQTTLRTIISGLQTFVNTNGGKKLMITEHTTPNVQATCYGLSSYNYGGPNEPETAAWYQALIQELESGSYSWYAGIQTWCCYHINDPVHWCTWRKLTETGPVRALWKLGKPAQTTVFTTDGGYQRTKGILPTNNVAVNASTVSISPLTGQSTVGSYWASPGDIVNVTTGTSKIYVYLPSIAYKTGSVTVRKIDAGSGSIEIASAWRTWVTAGNFDNYPYGHCLVDGANTKIISTAGGSATYQSNGSDFIAITPPSVQRFTKTTTTRAKFIMPGSSSKTAVFTP